MSGRYRTSNGTKLCSVYTIYLLSGILVYASKTRNILQYILPRPALVGVAENFKHIVSNATFHEGLIPRPKTCHVSWNLAAVEHCIKMMDTSIQSLSILTLSMSISSAFSQLELEMDLIQAEGRLAQVFTKYYSVSVNCCSPNKTKQNMTKQLLHFYTHVLSTMGLLLVCKVVPIDSFDTLVVDETDQKSNGWFAINFKCPILRPKR